MAKIDAGLRYFAAAAPADRRRASLLSVRSAPGRVTMANVMVEVEAGIDTLPTALIEAGFEPRTRAGTVFTGGFPRQAIAALEEIDGLKRAEAARPLRRELDVALPAARVTAVHNGTPTRRGRGTLVGIIDHGIDYLHQSFRNGDGSSRILRLWDQRLVPQSSGERSPRPFGYGVEYTKDEIDAAMRSGDPRQQVRHEDVAPFHGTHVAGVAAGNGRAGGAAGVPTFVGVAPEADLIIVANTRGAESDPGSFGDSADTLDAVSYILAVARELDRPVAINLSQGDTIGPHDGTSLLEVGIANLMQESGRALIKSAGNEAVAGRHAESGIPAAGFDDIGISIPANQAEVVIDLWYPSADRITATLTSPGHNETAPIGPPFSKTLVMANGNTVFAHADDRDPGNQDRRTFIAVQAGTLAAVERGPWTLRLAGTGRWHAWIQLTSGAKFVDHLAEQGTISVPGTSKSVITVASFVSKDADPFSVGTLSALSSRGPTRDGRRGITLAAPGEEIKAPQPRKPPPSAQDDRFVFMKGTSMAAAMVTGAVALLFEVNREATADQICTCLERAATQDGQTQTTPNTEWGAGKLNVERACQCIAALLPG